MKKLTPVVLTICVLIAVILAFLWVNTPFAGRYSLQVFVLATGLYFLIKKLNSKKMWEIGPGYLSLEMSFFTFATLVLVGGTGNISSIYFPLSYLHLLFLVLSATPGAAIVTGFAVFAFHASLVNTWNLANLIDLFTLIVALLIFLAVKSQYWQLKTQEKKLEDEEKQAVEDLRQKLQPKIDQIKALAQEAKDSKTLNETLDSLQQEVVNLESHLEGYANGEKK